MAESASTNKIQESAGTILFDKTLENAIPQWLTCIKSQGDKKDVLLSDFPS